MRFKYQELHGLLDAQYNFEQIQTAFGFPVASAPPPNPTLAQTYFDVTLGQCGYWNGSSWVYW